ncbi:MAG: hypothetical protein HYT65_01825 [Candidatus Yanofskybacteria bacterium]|nr:hypothetical protein [Candidatus Yanofskybacteria bacterium]
MSKTMTYGDAAGTLKVAVAIATAMLLVVGLVYFLGIQNTFAVAPSDYGLREGDVVSAAGSDDPDVYIVNDWGYKRLFLNPAIFGFYGHLGGFAAVKNVSPATRDAFGTSGLFRNCETNDERVYGVETTGEDTGMLHWVNTSGSQAVADDPNFFKKVFCINNNEFSWYSKGSDYSSVNQVPSYARTPGATPAPTGPLSVSLAPDNPAAKTITKNASGAEFLKVRFSGSGTINSLTIKRLGAGETNDFANVYVYDGAKRLVSGKTFSSSSGEATFVSLNIAVSGTKDLSIVADMDSTNNTAGNVNYIQLLSVGASGSVSGTPVSGNNMSTSGASSGGVTLVRSGSLSNPTVGQKNARISEFKITANTEAASVRRLMMINGGSIKPADLTNVKLETGTSSWSGSSTSDGYLVFDLGSGYTIAKGGNAVFKVFADIAGKKSETIDLYFENDADTHAIGDQYGQGMAVTDTDIDAASDVTDLTLQGGVLTIAFNGPTASNVSTNATDVTMLRFSMTVASNIEIRKTELVVCADVDGNGTYATVEDTTDGLSADILDVKVWNEDTNQVVMGPVDGTAFNEADDVSCPDSVDGAKNTFTDVLDLLTGQTYNFKVTMDLDADGSAETGTADLDANSVIRMVLDSYPGGDVTVMKYSGTNTSVAATDVVPNADVSGPNITIKGSSLTLGLAASPTDRTYIKGTSGAEFVGITFAAAQGSGLKVTDIKLTGYAEDDPTDTTFNEGVDDDTNDTSVSIASALSSVSLYDAGNGALISSSPSNNSLATSDTGTISFTGLNWMIAAGETRTLLVKANLSNNEASGSGGDGYAFDINTTTDVTAIDDSNNTVNAAAASVDPNGGVNPTNRITVKNSGNLTVAAAPATPAIGAVYWGQMGAEFSKFRFTTTDEGQYLEEVTMKTLDTIANVTANVKKVYLVYKNKAGSTLTSEGVFDTNASVSFAWTGDSRPYVPADSSMDMTVKADMKLKAEGATNNVNFSIDFSGGGADEFRSVGESGTVTTGTDADILDRAANNQYAYRVFPKFTNLSASSGGNAIGGNKEVIRFTIEAVGLPDSKLFFDGGVNGASGSIRFDTVASGQTNSDMTLTFFGADDNVTYGTDVISTAQSGTDVVASLSFGTSGTGQDLEISGGSSKTIYATTTFVNFATNGDHFQLVLRDEATQVNWVANSDVDDSATASTANVLKTLPLNGTSFVTTGL